MTRTAGEALTLGPVVGGRWSGRGCCAAFCLFSTRVVTAAPPAHMGGRARGSVPAVLDVGAASDERPARTGGGPRRSGPGASRADAILAAGCRGASSSGLAAGIRVQTSWLTVPLLGLALFVAAAQGLVMACLTARCGARGRRSSSGQSRWLPTAGAGRLPACPERQAGEDFAWVNMLWLEPTPRRLAFALYETFVLPWGSLPLRRRNRPRGRARTRSCALRAVNGAHSAVLLVAFAPYAAVPPAVSGDDHRPVCAPDRAAGRVARRARLGVTSAGRHGSAPARWSRGALVRGGTRQALRTAATLIPRFRRSPTRRDVPHRRRLLRCIRTTASGALSRRRAGTLACRRTTPAVRMARPRVATGNTAAAAPIWFLADPRPDGSRHSSIRSHGSMSFATHGRLRTGRSWAARDRWGPIGTGLRHPAGLPEKAGRSRPRRAAWRGRLRAGRTTTDRSLGAAAPAARCTWSSAAGTSVSRAIPPPQFELALDGVVRDRWTLTFDQRNFLRFLDSRRECRRRGRLQHADHRVPCCRRLTGAAAASRVRQFDIQSTAPDALRLRQRDGTRRSTTR